MAYREKLHESLKQTTKKLIAHEPIINEVGIIESPLKLEDFSIIVGMVGNIEGQLIFGFEKDILKKIAQNMGELEDFTNDHISISLISEFANILTGNAVTYLSEHGYEGIKITPPSIVIGQDVNLSTKLEEIHKYLLTFDENIGVISLYIALKHNN
ncbi:MAG: CheC domain protein [Fusobacteriales bacterium]|jgi:chemotaxis protein CheX|nr:CheC domain protein [Fusobacteriales bacterium]